jgi:tetratricopeptide (TPR) repeat protein
MTLTGEFMGTPQYMSPEQIAAGRAPLDHRTDIYSLGATLYELLTLEPPFPGERREQVIAQIIGKDPAPLRRINRKVPVDLETICLKAMEKDPDRRYQTAGQMAADLRAYVNRFAISAKRAGPTTRAIKWCRRRPAVAGLLGAVVLLAIAAGALAYGAHRSNARMLDMQRQQAIDDAFVWAIGGDFAASEAAIRRAESLGASPGWICMMRGQVAFERGDAVIAITQLEQAVQLMPDSVAARGLLARACALVSRHERNAALLRELNALAPISAEDYLFKGFAQTADSPVEALRTLDEGIKRRDSALARLIRTTARTGHAMMTGNARDVELALEDAIVAKSMLPDNVVALRTHLLAHLVGANVLEEAGDATRRAICLTEAQRDAEALGGFPGNSLAHDARAWYFEHIGDDEAAITEWCARAEATGAWWGCAWEYYRMGAMEQALTAIERTALPQRDMRYYLWRACIVLELPERHGEALADYDSAMRSNPQGYNVLMPQMILYLLGRKSDARAAVARLGEQYRNMPAWMPAWYQHLFRYVSGNLPAEELLRTAGASRGHRCEAHFWIGLSSLAEGDRHRATAHFRDSVATRVFDFFEYTWSRCFLARLQQDPTWPPWIPRGEATERRSEKATEGSAGVLPATQPASAPEEGQP